MCTAVSFKTKDHYFGRNLDFEFSYEETVTITPRNYRFLFCDEKEAESHYTANEKLSRHQYVMNGKQSQHQHIINEKLSQHHYAMIGMAYVVADYPLYYDATNEKGLSMAGLLFAGNAVYSDSKVPDKDNVAAYEFIPWVLTQCATIEEVKILLDRINLTGESFSPNLPPSPLHWLIADGNAAITVEAVAEGLKVYDNPVKVLTNNPPFDFQMMNLNHYLHLSIDVPTNQFSNQVELVPYSRGMGALGLPGDLSSVSRFVRAAFTRMNSVSGDSEEESISQFFHILGSVCQQRGCVRMPKKDNTEAASQKDRLEERKEDYLKKTEQKDEYEITIYSSCCNTDKGIYYYTTYENQQITAVDMRKENLDSDKLISYPLITRQQIKWQN